MLTSMRVSMSAISPHVVSVSCDSQHHFSKTVRTSIRLIAQYGIEGDAHAGITVRHRYLARRFAKLPNLRQVHLIQAELFLALAKEGFRVDPGDLGENITTHGIDLIALPLGTRLQIGNEAVVILTGLRTPCIRIDRFQKGLKRTMIVRTPDGVRFRAGVMGVVAKTGSVKAGDRIAVEWPAKPWTGLPALP